MQYRVKTSETFYEVQKRVTYGWGIFSNDIWITVETYWDIKDAYNHVNKLIKLENDE